jgi:hypothetical protein
MKEYGLFYVGLREVASWYVVAVGEVGRKVGMEAVVVLGHQLHVDV